MASFLSPSYIPQFGNYVPSIDPNSYAQTQEVYRHAILQKAQDYQSGISKVQGAYDTVAGLKMGREVDTQYLNQKIQGIQSNLQKLVGADFSQANVVNQAAGYAAQIYSDPRIQNAAMSAQNASDASAQIQQAHKDGKGAASNDNLILRNVNAWQNGDENATLGKQTYNPYYNYNKAWQDFISKVHPNVVIEETPNGAKSPYGVAYTLNQGKKEYLTAGQMQQNFNTFLATDNQAAQQVQTDALYYSDRTPNEVAIQNINANYRNQANQLEIAAKRAEENKAIFTSSADVARLEEQRQNYLSQRDLINMNLDRGVYAQDFLKNPEQGKMNLFQSNLSQGIANVYAYDITENKTVKNPEFDALIDQDRLNIAKNDALLRQAEFGLRQQEFGLKQQEFQYKQTLEGRDASGQLTPTFTPVSAPPTPDQFIADNAQIGEKVTQNQLKALYDTGNMDSLVRVGTDANGNAKYFLQNGRTDQDFHNTWDNIKQTYATNPNTAKASIKAYFSNPDDASSGIGLQNIYFSTQAAIDNTEKSLQERFANDPDYIRYVNSLKNLDVNRVVFSANGVNLTRGDIIKYSDNINSGNNKTSGLPPEKVALIQQAEKSSRPSGGSIYEINSSQQNNPFASVRQELIRANDLVTNKNKYKEARTAAYQPRLAGLQSTVSSSESTAGANGKAVQDDLARLQSIVATGRDSEKAALDGVLADSGPKTRTYTRNADGSFTATISSGKNTATVILSPYQVPQGTGLLRPNPNAVIETDLRNSRQGGNGASSTTSNYYYPQTNNLQNYQIQAKYKDNGQGQVTPIIQYHVVGSNTWIPLPDNIYFPSIDQAKAYFNEIAAKGDDYFAKTFLTR